MSDAAWIAVCAAVPLTITAVAGLWAQVKSSHTRRELTDRLVETTFREAQAQGAVAEHRRRLTDRAEQRKVTSDDLLD